MCNDGWDNGESVRTFAQALVEMVLREDYQSDEEPLAEFVERAANNFPSLYQGWCK